jgi:hypothetical protein
VQTSYKFFAYQLTVEVLTIKEDSEITYIRDLKVFGKDVNIARAWVGVK